MNKWCLLALGALVASAAHADEGRRFYVGVDRVDATFSTSTPQTVFDGSNTGNFNQSSESETKFLRIRAGVDLSEDIGLELQFGKEDDQADAASGTGELGSYGGIFIVPRGRIFGYFDLELPLGFAKVEYHDPNGNRADVDGVAYGLNLGLSLTQFLGDEDREDRAWNLRLIAGGMVYQQDRDSRFYGYNAGLRLEF